MDPRNIFNTPNEDGLEINISEFIKQYILSLYAEAKIIFVFWTQKPRLEFFRHFRLISGYSRCNNNILTKIKLWLFTWSRLISKRRHQFLEKLVQFHPMPVSGIISCYLVSVRTYQAEAIKIFGTSDHLKWLFLRYRI